jgi:hypothetical protein
MRGIYKMWIALGIFAIAPQIFSATVVTSNERIAGTITGKTKSSVTIKIEEGHERTIDRSRIVQIFGDNGKLLYTSPALMTPPPSKKAKPFDEKDEQGHQKHDGLFVRLLGGGGSFKFKETPVLTNNTGTGTAEGHAGFYAIQIGYAVLENLIIYGARNALTAPEPEYRLNGSTFGILARPNLDVTSFGGGVSYYISTLNLYFSADVGSTVTSLAVGSNMVKSQPGLGINLQIGKEWWVAKDLGLGVAFYFHQSNMDDQATGPLIPRISNTLYGLAISVTYN